MKTLHLEHGDAELWTRIGEFATSREVHKELGGPIYSAAGMHWWLAIERGKVVGFISARPTNTGLWLDYAYVVDGSRDKGIHGRLSAARDKFVRAHYPDLPLRIAVRADRWTRVYKPRGWTEDRRRGSWVYGSRAPEETS